MCTKQLPREHPLPLFSCRKHPWRSDSYLQPFAKIQEPKSHHQGLLQHRQGLFNLMLSQGAVTTQVLCCQRSGLHLLALEPSPILSQQATSLSSISSSLSYLKRKLPKHEMNAGSANTQLPPNWLFKCTWVNAGTQRCISLQGWKVCSPPEAAGLTFHKLQSCFPFLLIFSFQRSFTTRAHTLTKQGKVKGAAWFPGTGVSHSINEANLQYYYKDISICSWLGRAPCYGPACVQHPGSGGKCKTPLCTYFGLLKVPEHHHHHHHQGLEQPAPGEGIPGQGRGWTEMSF